MPLNPLQRFGLGLSDPAALSRYQTQQESLALQREEMGIQQEQFAARQSQQQNQMAARAAMQILQVAPQGSKARALAILALRNAGMSDENLLQALELTSPEAAKRETKVVGRSLVEIPGAGPVQELYRAPVAPERPQRPSEIERMIKRVAKSPEEEEALIRQYIAARATPDPMRQLMANVLGGGGGRVQELTPKQTDAVRRAREAIEKGVSVDKAKRLLKGKYGLTDDQVEAQGL